MDGTHGVKMVSVGKGLTTCMGHKGLKMICVCKGLHGVKMVSVGKGLTTWMEHKGLRWLVWAKG